MSVAIKVGKRKFSSLQKVAAFYKKNYWTIYSRMYKLGWSVIEAVQVPVNKNMGRY